MHDPATWRPKFRPRSPGTGSSDGPPSSSCQPTVNFRVLKETRDYLATLQYGQASPFHFDGWLRCISLSYGPPAQLLYHGLGIEQRVACDSQPSGKSDCYKAISAWSARSAACSILDRPAIGIVHDLQLGRMQTPQKHACPLHAVAQRDTANSSTKADLLPVCLSDAAAPVMHEAE
jgi:hypothetical protein